MERSLVSDAYDFTRSGFGDYSIEPSNRFTYIDANGTPKNLNATVEGAANVRLSGNLGIPKPPPFVPFTNCTDNQKRVIGTTAIAAQHLASGSYNYIKAMSDPTPRYKAWFGRYSAARKKEVRKIFSRINRKTKFAELTYVCKCLDQGVSSFVCMYNFHPWSRYSVADKPLNQIQSIQNCFSSALALQTSIQVTAPRYLSTRLPAILPMAAHLIFQLVRMLPRSWLRMSQQMLYIMRTITCTLLRMSILCHERCCCGALIFLHSNVVQSA